MLGHIQDCKRARILKEKRQKRKVVTHAKAHITHIFYINCSLFFHQFGYIYLPIQLKIMGCPFSFTTLICFLVTGWYQHRTYKYSVWNKYLWWKTEIDNRQIAEIRPSLIACLFVWVCVCIRMMMIWRVNRFRPFYLLYRSRREWSNDRLSKTIALQATIATVWQLSKTRTRK